MKLLTHLCNYKSEVSQPILLMMGKANGLKEGEPKGEGSLEVSCVAANGVYRKLLASQSRSQNPRDCLFKPEVVSRKSSIVCGCFMSGLLTCTAHLCIKPLKKPMPESQYRTKRKFHRTNFLTGILSLWSHWGNECFRPGDDSCPGDDPSPTVGEYFHSLKDSVEMIFKSEPRFSPTIRIISNSPDSG
ncbi:hypothetical protein COLO4_00320 [Corchorus olitorius]|uniref:Uncharacterized protein n=1 Tax=Corchorus olitorius TaxID=93759 RepID=A0A1R3L421_9ROSI|nr:hypothetical protein COLO4_00320 [Corchorus olitorius]